MVAQICNRIVELYGIDSDHKFKLSNAIDLKLESTAIVYNRSVSIYKKNVFPQFQLNCKSRDQWFS